MLKSQEKRIEFLDTMRAIAMFMVVGQHAIGYNQLDPLIRSKITPWFQIAVPVFFLVDGFLFLRSLDANSGFDYKSYIKKSINRLLIPWVVFSILYAFARLAYEYFDGAAERVVLAKSLSELVGAIWVGAASGQMYFLPSLFFLRALSVVTIWLEKVSPWNSVCGVAAAGIVWWTSQNAALLGQYTIRANWGGGQDPLVHALWGMQFYLMGCALYLFRSWLNERAGTTAAVCWSIAISISFFKLNFAVLQQYSYLLGFYFAFMAFPSGLKFLSFVGRFTMGIYLLHFPAIMKVTSIAVSHLFDPTRVVYYWIVVAVVYLVSFLASIQLMKIRKFRLVLGEKA